MSIKVGDPVYVHKLFSSCADAAAWVYKIVLLFFNEQRPYKKLYILMWHIYVLEM